MMKSIIRKIGTTALLASFAFAQPAPAYARRYCLKKPGNLFRFRCGHFAGQESLLGPARLGAVPRNPAQQRDSSSVANFETGGRDAGRRQAWHCHRR